ncbi:hypothetical protein [Mucilaginibacter lacusdianchii]|uniref:hypothetical protein n=1 Tax=Mucilaginibacter lacusdianchii TaxID=2684211 RepID=UPI00131B6C2D|nr:hypothetical protein [Mucilaginibacter sp. JXJ CY 39]
MEIDMENMQWPDEDAVLRMFPKGSPFTVPDGYFDDLSQRLQSYVHLDDLKQDEPAYGFTVPENYFDDLSSQIQSRIAIEEALPKDTLGLTVPENYFDELSSNIQSRIAIEEITSAEDAGFKVPEGYFDELSNNIQSRIAIDEMVNAEDDGFTVPQGYFDELSSNLMSRIAIEDMAGQPNEAGYVIPEGYFDQLHEQITGRIQLEESVNADNAFTVPEGYFSQLTESILSQTSEKQEAKVVIMQPARRSIIRKLVSSAALKYASAACFALIVGVAIYVKQGASPEAQHKNSVLHKELSEIPASAIESYLEQQTDASDSEHTVVTESTQLDINSLKAALQDDLDEE